MRCAVLILCGALMASGPASAMRARDFIDADQRVPVSLPADHVPTTVSVQQAVDVAAAVTPEPEEQLPAQPSQGAPSPISPVPEPSSWLMAGCGLLMLMLVPHKKGSPAFSNAEPG